MLSEELHRLKQEKQALDVDLQLMKKERDLAIAQVISSTGERHVRALKQDNLIYPGFWEILWQRYVNWKFVFPETGD